MKKIFTQRFKNLVSYKDIGILFILYILILLICNFIVYGLFYTLVIQKGIPINSDISQISIFFMFLILTLILINNFIFSALIKFKKINSLSKNIQKKIQDSKYIELLKNSYLYSLIYPLFFIIILLILIALGIEFIKFFITLKGMVITLSVIVILLILWISKYQIFKLAKKLLETLEVSTGLLEKLKGPIGMLFRFIIIISITYLLITWIDLRNIFDIPLSELTLKDIGKIILNLLIIYFFIFLWLLNQPTTEERKSGIINEKINYILWFDSGLSILIIGSLIYIYLSNK